MIAVSPASSTGVSASQSFIMPPPKGLDGLRLASLFAACVVVSGASTPTYAASMCLGRTNGSTPYIIVAGRAEETKTAVQLIIAELKDASGLTWDQIGKLVGVSRRAVHNWVNGQVAKPAHIEALSGLLDNVRAMGNLKPFQIRRKLIETVGGTRPLVGNSEPAILIADQTPFTHQLKVRRGTSTQRKSRNDSAA